MYDSLQGVDDDHDDDDDGINDNLSVDQLYFWSYYGFLSYRKAKSQPYPKPAVVQVMEYDQLNIVLRNNSQIIMETTMMMVIMMMEQMVRVWRVGAAVRDCRLVWRSHKRAGSEAQLRLWLGGADINLRHLNSLDTNLAPKHENQKFVNNNKIS